MKLLSVTKSVKYCLNGTLRHLKMTNDIFPSKFSAKKKTFFLFFDILSSELRGWRNDWKIKYYFLNCIFFFKILGEYQVVLSPIWELDVFLMLQSKLIFVSFHLSYLIYQNYSKGNHTSYWRKSAFVAKKYLRVVDSICCNNDHLNSFYFDFKFSAFLVDISNLEIKFF